MSKMNLNWDFALSGEIIHHNFSFYAIIFDLNLNDCIQSQYFVTLHENFEWLWKNTASFKILLENNNLPATNFFY